MAMKPSPLNATEIKQIIQREQQDIHSDIDERLHELSASINSGVLMTLRKDDAAQESEFALAELRATFHKEHGDIHVRIDKQLKELEVLREQAAVQEQSLPQLQRRLDALEGTRNSASSSLRSLVEIPSPTQKLIIVDRIAGQDASPSPPVQLHSSRCPSPRGPNDLNKHAPMLSPPLVVQPGQPAFGMRDSSPSGPSAAIRLVSSPQRSPQRSPRRGAACHACSNLLMPDSNFCRICGRPGPEMTPTVNAGVPWQPGLSCSTRQA